jgi:hypothetical protein
MPLREIAGASELAIKASHRSLISHRDEITRLILEASSPHEPTGRANARPMTGSAICGIEMKQAPDDARPVSAIQGHTRGQSAFTQNADMPLHLIN